MPLTRIFVGCSLCIVILWLFAISALVSASPADSTTRALLKTLVPEATRITDKTPIAADKPPVWTLYKEETLLGYAFQSIDVVDIPAYSGKPINMLVAMDPQGKFIASKVLEHHEPILLVGIPEQKLFDFAQLYSGFSVTDTIRIGGSNNPDVISFDAISGATVTVMVVNETIMRAARKVARALELPGFSASDQVLPATIKANLYTPADWLQLLGDGSLRRLALTRGQVDTAFAGTEAEEIDRAKSSQQDDIFIELVYAPLNIPTIGRNLLGESQYQWLMGELLPGDQAIAVLGKGRYSFKGNGYVRGGIFDRTQLRQAGKLISFHDTDYYRLDDVYIDGFPGFSEMAIFIVRSQYEFDSGTPWLIELLVRRQVGALDSVFSSFSGEYQTPEKYIDRPAPVLIDEAFSQPLWISVWQQRQFQIVVLGVSLILLLVVIFLQDWLVHYPRLLHTIRNVFLIYTVVFIGWYTLGQLSVVNVFTFVHALMGDFQWTLFLLDPMLFILWGFVALTILLWGRGIYCGWLCPFGAMQELINQVARKLQVRQFEPPFVVHERLWALKYMILLALFALSLESLGEAERYAEIEPFKTAILLRFQREWGYVLYAVGLLVIAIFTRKFFCRYLCPLGAALAIPSQLRLFDWLKRRKECGVSCQVCAVECEIQAIHPDGHINANECHYCLDCQMTYFDEDKCPPLVTEVRKKAKAEVAAARVRDAKLPNVTLAP